MAENVDAEHNAAVLEYLTYYCDPANPFNFAVMVKGAWGCGKTYTIKRFEKGITAKHGINVFYISLNGLSATSQIDEELFRLLHPVLGSKSVRFVGRLIKGAISGALKFDLDDDSSAQAKINVPDLSAMDAKLEKGVLIFDDLERCRIGLPEVLGYINAFVEHNMIKTIIVANEDEIHRLEADNTKPGSKYAAIKEKLIGRTVELAPNTLEALDDFLAGLRASPARTFLVANKSLLLDLHHESRTNNLRILQQAIWDVEQLATALEEKHWENKEALRTIVAATMALSFEMRAGRLTQADLTGFEPKVAMLMREQRGSPASKMAILQRTYPSIDFETSPLKCDVFGELLFDGRLRKSAIQEQLTQSPFFAAPTEIPPWRMVIEIWRAGEKEFHEALAQLEDQFRKREFDDAGQLMLIFSLRLLLSDIGVLKYSKQKVVAQSRAYITSALRKGRVKPTFAGGSLPDHNSWGGFSFPCDDTAEFHQIRAAHIEAVNTATKRALPNTGKELLNLLSNDTRSFIKAISYTDDGQPKYWDIPVLHAINVDKFVRAVAALPASPQAAVFEALKDRFVGDRLHKKLAPERKWAEKVETSLKKRLPSIDPIVRFRLKSHLANYVTPFITP